MMSESKDLKEYIEALATMASKEKKIGIVNDIVYLITDKGFMMSESKVGRDFEMGLYSLTKENLSMLRLLIWMKIKNIEDNK